MTPAGSLGALLPAQVHYAEALCDDDGAADGAGLLAAELAAIGRAVPKRRAEYTTVRRCARTALAELGVADHPLVKGELGAPQWPDGVVGSMTHCAGYRGAAVALTAHITTVGIDAEPNAALPDGVLDRIARPEDLRDLPAAAGATPAWDRLLFSAKESVYKAWYPLARTFLDFAAASVRFDPDGRFTATLHVPGPLVHGVPLTGFAGRWTATPQLLITSIVLPAPR